MVKTDTKTYETWINAREGQTCGKSIGNFMSRQCNHIVNEKVVVIAGK